MSNNDGENLHRHCVLGINLNSNNDKILTTLRSFEQFVLKRTYYNIFSNRKIGSITFISRLDALDYTKL